MRRVVSSRARQEQVFFVLTEKSILDAALFSSELGLKTLNNSSKKRETERVTT